MTATPPSRWVSRRSASTFSLLVSDLRWLRFGGVVAAPITTVDFRGGVDILPFCFMAVIIGGLGNLPGTAAAAVLLAFLEGMIQSVADPTVARISSLVLMSAVLLLRPQGLFKGFDAADRRSPAIERVRAGRVRRIHDRGAVARFRHWSTRSGSA